MFLLLCFFRCYGSNTGHWVMLTPEKICQSFVKPLACFTTQKCLSKDTGSMAWNTTIKEETVHLTSEPHTLSCGMTGARLHCHPNCKTTICWEDTRRWQQSLQTDASISRSPRCLRILCPVSTELNSDRVLSSPTNCSGLFMPAWLCPVPVLCWHQ